MPTEPEPRSREQRPELAVSHPQDGISVLEVRCELDMVTTPSFQRLLIQELDDGCRALVIDLCGCEFLGSMGLAALVDGKQQAERTATALAVAGMNRIVGRALHATGLEPLFNTYPRATDAISALSQDDRNHLPDPRPS